MPSSRRRKRRNRPRTRPASKRISSLIDIPGDALAGTAALLNEFADVLEIAIIEGATGAVLEKHNSTIRLVISSRDGNRIFGDDNLPLLGGESSSPSLLEELELLKAQLAKSQEIIRKQNQKLVSQSDKIRELRTSLLSLEAADEHPLYHFMQV